MPRSILSLLLILLAYQGTAAEGTKVEGTQVAANDASVVASPYNWAPDANAPGALKAWNPGAYLRFNVLGTTAVILRLDPGSANGSFRYAIDTGPITSIVQPIGTGEVPITLPDANQHEIWVYLASIPEAAGRWDGTLFFGVYGITIPRGAKHPKALRAPRNLLIFGDSITEGIAAKDGTNDNQYDYSYYVGQQFLKLGYEYGIVACGSSGYTTIGAGSTPNAWKQGEGADCWWDKVNATTPRVEKGLMVPHPDIIVENWGANDGLQGHTGTVAQVQIVGLWRALRGACPNAKILKVIPFGGYDKEDIIAAYATYGTSDMNFRVVDLDIESRQALYGGLHPGIWGHANIATLLSGEIINFIGLNTGRPGQHSH